MSLPALLAAERTLLCFLQGLQGTSVDVKLKNQTSIQGTLDSVDAAMKFGLVSAYCALFLAHYLVS